MTRSNAQIGNDLDIKGGLNVGGAGNFMNTLSVFSRGGNSSFVINSNGNVGVGTTNPQNLFQVNTSAAGSLIISSIYSALATNGTYNGIVIGKQSGIGTNAGFGYVYNTDPNSAGAAVWVGGDDPSAGTGLFVKKGGNVGIGTTSPGTKLAVAGNISLMTNSWVTYGDITNPSIGTPVGIGHVDGQGLYFDVYKLGGGGSLGSSSMDAMVIQQTTGNVGIGTSNPLTKLQIGNSDAQNTLRVTGSSTADNAPVISFLRSGVREAYMGVLGTGSGAFVIGNTAGLSDFTDATLTTNANLAISTTGDVGIGTTSPVSPGGYNKFLEIQGGYASLVINSTTSNAEYEIGGSAVGNLDFARGPTALMSINGSSGKVGIGTTSPIGTLNVNGNDTWFTGTSGITSNANGLDIGGGNNLSFIYARGDALTAGNTLKFLINSGNITFNTGNGGTTEVMRILNNGNVGIGTTSPVAKLDVAGTSRFGVATNQHVWLESTGSGDYGSQVYLTNDLGTSQGAVKLGSAYTGFGTSGNPNFAISRSTTNQVYGADPSILTYTPSLVIDGSNGNVGIGTTNPGTLLDVTGSSADRVRVRINNTATVGSRSTALMFTDAGLPWEIGTDLEQTGVHSFYIHNGSNTLMYFGANGNVGIGTTSPGTTLDSFGYIRTLDNIANNYPPTGAGLEIGATGGRGYIQAYNRTGNYYELLTLNGILHINGTSGNVGIGTTSPGQKLSVVGAINQTNALSCGLSTDASGTIICTSDERLKNILGNSSYGLNQIMNITPIKFEYKNESYVHVGFSAQNVQASIPEATPIQGNGYLGLDANAITATLVNAMKQQQEIINQQNETINNLQEKLNNICTLNNLKGC